MLKMSCLKPIINNKSVVCMNGTDVMAMYEAKKARRVFLYKNGSKYAQPKCLVVNERHIRDFGTFLSRVTSGLRAPVAIRNIYTPTAGHPVNSLEGLCSDGYYVAGGNEQFKKIEYGTGAREVRFIPRRSKRATEFSIPHTSPQKAKTMCRYNLPIEKPFIIHMFRNGDEKYRGARVLLPRRIMGSWEHVLQLITNKAELVTPAKRICTLDGRAIHAVSEIQDGGKYVALESSKPFQKVAYCATDGKNMSLLRTVPKAATRLKRRTDQLQALDGGGRMGNPDKIHATRGVPVRNAVLQQNALLCPSKQRKGMRPMAGRKNKEGREKAIKDQNSKEDSIFGGSPIRDLGDSFHIERTPSPPLRSNMVEESLQASRRPSPLRSSITVTSSLPQGSIKEDTSTQDTPEDPRGNLAATRDEPNFPPGQSTALASKTSPTPKETAAIHSKNGRDNTTVSKSNLSPTESQDAIGHRAASRGSPKPGLTGSQSKDTDTTTGGSKPSLISKHSVSYSPGPNLTPRASRSTTRGSPTTSSLTGKDFSKSSKPYLAGKDSRDSAANSPKPNITLKESRNSTRNSPKPSSPTSKKSRDKTTSLLAKDNLDRGTGLLAGEEVPYMGEEETAKDGVFHADPSSTRPQYSTAEYVDEAHGGLFKAKEQRTEAEIVAEGGETVVEHPIDHLEAEVVEEEVVLDGEQPGKGNHEAAGHEQEESRVANQMEVVPSSEDVPESMDVEEEPPEKEIGLNKVMETRVEEEDTEAARSSTEPTQNTDVPPSLPSEDVPTTPPSRSSLAPPQEIQE